MMFLSVLFSGIGIGYFIYGKKQKKIVPFCVGIALFGYTYFMPNVISIIVVGVVLILLPKFIK
ncbi:hypothetical protein TYM08_P0376 [Marinicellulosiphila megalodicopiae]